MASKCNVCKFVIEECNQLRCPRCTGSMSFSGCGTCDGCFLKITKKEN